MTRLNFLDAKTWLDEDGEHIHFRHECVNGWIEGTLPNTWHAEGKKVVPSINCSICDLHYFAELEEVPA